MGYLFRAGSANLVSISFNLARWSSSDCGGTYLCSNEMSSDFLPETNFRDSRFCLLWILSHSERASQSTSHKAAANTLTLPRTVFPMPNMLHKKSGALSLRCGCLRGLPRPIQQWCPLVPSIFYQSTTFIIRLSLAILTLHVTDNASSMSLQRVSSVLA